MAINWIASYPKSGNTWIRMFMSAYDSGFVDINNPRGMKMDDLFLYYWQVVSPKPIGELTVEEGAAMRGAVLLHLLYSNENKVPCKTHSMAGSYLDFPLIPPTMSDKSIYIIRDPRAVTVSWAQYSGKPIDEIIDVMTVEASFAKIPGLWNITGRWDTHVKSWWNLNEEYNVPVHFMRYEDLMVEPIFHFGNMIEFLSDKPSNLGQVVAAEQACGFLNLQEQERLHGFREHTRGKDEEGTKFFRKGANDWRDHLTEEQNDRISNEFESTMRQWEYPILI